MSENRKLIKKTNQIHIESYPPLKLHPHTRADKGVPPSGSGSGLYRKAGGLFFGSIGDATLWRTPGRSEGRGGKMKEISVKNIGVKVLIPGEGG